MSGNSNKHRVNKHRADRDTGNPCIGLCRFGGNGACLGCHRTKAEVKGWKRLSDSAKAAINARLRQGIDAAPTEGKSPLKRLRKLDRKIGKLEAKLESLRAERQRVAG
ncbi:DUF1289 domain-containing protein [Azospirillum sp. B506]|uniref:DUF1289 domain-containing protein n=1 Tax=Azospirillum sp. B506 TaxID=137721 RepID=UPI000348577A|nr:DUF1289 domain-containing protein [Azospirillum sp. B506]